MVVDRESGAIQHAIFKDIGEFIDPGDMLVLNETRVIPARLYASKIPTGGRVEILLLHKREDHVWEALVGGKGLGVGMRLQVESGPEAEIIAVLDGARRVVRFDQPVEPFLQNAGHVPLPPYIHKEIADPERYQTVYARSEGSAAAPTAGLHFTHALIEQLREQGIGFASVILHVGLDTFAPVNETDPQQHKIHTEWCQVTQEAADRISRAHSSGSRIIAVGTTSVRTLESAASKVAGDALVNPYEGSTGLFILPGYQFKVVEAMITNFHLPRSTLIMLVSAFAGRETILNAYEIAKREKYRFYSFGDAMLIL